jgi:hypothetical protein
MRAELEKIICSGATKNGKQTYALLSERVKNNNNLGKEQALAQLARRYFTSRCPATVQDFKWWSGLTAADTRLGMDLVKGDFQPEEINGRTYLFPNDFYVSNSTIPVAFLLPPYDEFTLSYADRSASIPEDLENHLKVISDRGIFRPVMIVDGQVIGMWKRTINKDTITIEINPFKKIENSTLELINQAAQNYAAYLEKKLALTLHPRVV